MSEEIDESPDLFDKLGDILTTAATSPAGIGLISVLIGALLKTTHRPAYRIIDKPDPVTGKWHGTGGMLVPESGGLDVILARTISANDALRGVERGIELWGLDIWNWAVGSLFPSEVKPEPPPMPQEGATVWLSDMLIIAGLTAIGGAGVNAAAQVLKK